MPLHLQVLTAILHESGRDIPASVAIAFELPTRQWVGSLSRPTVNFFLYDLQENTELRQPNPQARRARGEMAHRMPPRRFDLRYLVAAFCSVAADEQLLLWRMLAVLLKHPELPVEALADEPRGLEAPIPTRIGRPDDAPRALELWNALDLPPRPALFYTVTAPLNLEVEFSAPLVLSTMTHFTAPPAGGELDSGLVTQRDPETRAPLDGLVLAGTRRTSGEEA
jgi:hypothetical protein